MKLIINLLLVLVVLGLAYLLFSSIQEPIKFKNEKETRKEAVVDQLQEIRRAQELYREVTGQYAPSFKHLKDTLTTGEMRLISAFGDPDDENAEIRYDTIMVPAIDSVRSQEIDLDNLASVPFTDGKTFEINADTITYQQTVVNVVEVGTRWKEFMGKYADPRFAKYDDRYNPNARIKFGDMNAPNLSGNWE